MKMNLKKIALVTCLTVACVANSASQTNASIESLTNGIITKIEDNDYEVLIKGVDSFGAPNSGGSTVVEVGDFLLAIAEFPDFLTASTNLPYAGFSTGTSMLTSVSYTKVTSSLYTGGGTSTAIFSLGVASAGEWAAAGLGLPAPSSGTMLMVYDDLAGTHLPGVPGLTLAGGIASVTDGPLVWEFGFTGAGGTAVGGQFFGAGTADLAFSPDAKDILAIDLLSVTANLDVTSGPSGLLAGHDFLGFGLGLHQLQLFGGLGSGVGFDPGSFDIHTDTDAYVKFVPEPSSILVWSVLAAVAGICQYRRRKT